MGRRSRRIPQLVTYTHFKFVEAPVHSGEKGVKLVDKMSVDGIIR
jgi:hypothetical protein